MNDCIRNEIFRFLMAASNSFLMDSLSDSLLAAVSETSFFQNQPTPIAGKNLSSKIEQRVY